MFYAMLALLIDEPFASAKHSGVLSYFNRRFIREKVFSDDIGRAVNLAFELRQQGDYREYVTLVSVRKRSFSAMAASIFGIACAAYRRTPPRNPLISLPGRKIPHFRIGNQ
jgi:uncharacterized protein (UPF0332 family)